VNLLLRLFDPEEGGLYIDDQPLKDLATADWLKLIAVAGQDIDLIDGTVIENIKMADIGASESAVDSVLDFVGFSEWLSSLPDGYNTLVGQHGTRFSGGQRQRIGMARAALHGPKFLVLDEAMNAMDSALEERMREAIDVRFGDATVLLITHQLESIRNADHVIVLRDGKVIYEGMPQERILENPSAR
jgi:ABC-type multidrug transport system fused ATPase/permease subunit